MRYRLFILVILLFPAIHLAGQSCDVDFPGTSVKTYSAACGSSSSANLTLGKSIPFGNGDVFTFDLPEITSTGNLEINAEGSGKIVIPAGVTVTLNGNIKLDTKNQGCSSGNTCTFTIEVLGTLIITGNFQNKISNVEWSGNGTVIAKDNFDNDGCMGCRSSGCPSIQVNKNKCNDRQPCSGNFCVILSNPGCQADVVKPIITGCPSNQTISMTADACSVIANWNIPSSTDNCELVSLTSTHLPGSTFQKGITTVTYSATDATGNVATCSFTITVVDNIAPVIQNCPANIIVKTSSSTIPVNWNAPELKDNCPGGTLTSSKLPGSVFPEGTTTVVYTAMDVNGNSAKCSFDVTVVVEAAPIITGCPIDITVNGNGNCSNQVSWSAPTATGTSVSMSSSHNPGDIFPVGTTMVTYTATNNQGIKISCSFNITVTNSLPPIIIDCPENILLQANENGVALANWIAPTATAVCGTVTLTSSAQPGEFPIGTSVIEYQAVDDSGNTSTCTFNIIVSPPSIEIVVSRIVTPDGDGINDFWELSNLAGYNNNKVVIFDRWGGVIFEGSGYDNENVVWRGTNRKGALVSTGTYFYSIVVNYGSAKLNKTGFIEVIR